MSLGPLQQGEVGKPKDPGKDTRVAGFLASVMLTRSLKAQIVPFLGSLNCRQYVPVHVRSPLIVLVPPWQGVAQARAGRNYLAGVRKP